MTLRILLIFLMFILTAFLVYLGELWLAFIFLIISVLLIDYLNKKTLDSKFDELKNAQGSYPEGKLKKYSIEAGKDSIKVITKKRDQTTKMGSEPGKALAKGSKNFFEELNNLFK